MAKWDESKHPRVRGKFASKGGRKLTSVQQRTEDSMRWIDSIAKKRGLTPKRKGTMWLSPYRKIKKR